MEITTDKLLESFKYGYDAAYAARKLAAETWDLYHNKHYTEQQLTILNARSQPAETFNVIKMFTRLLLGYYSTVVNEVVVQPVVPREAPRSAAFNDVVKFVFQDNKMDVEGDRIKLGGILSGLIACHVTPQKTEMTDSFKRPVYRCNIEYVPDDELVLDPKSTKPNYEDGEFQHRFKWIRDTKLIAAFGKKKVDELQAYYNALGEEDTDFYSKMGINLNSATRTFDEYLVTHSVVSDDSGKRWSIIWSGSAILQKNEITNRDIRWPYRVQKISGERDTLYYGVFREIVEAQKSLNQAVLKIQLMINSEKAFIENTAVDDIDEFRVLFNKVNAVIPVNNLQGIKIENLSTEVRDQYTIIDQALSRIKMVLGINDSFLGMAFASDSGRKVKLQQNQSVLSLRYLTIAMQEFYQMLGEDVVKIINQYYNANQVISLTDEDTGQRWVELNKPISEFAGYDANGQPYYQPILLPYENPDNGKPIEDENGNIILAPVNDDQSEIYLSAYQVHVQAAEFNDEDERGQLLLETMLSGQVGMMMSQINPQGFFRMSAMSLKSMKTRYTPQIVEVLQETANMLASPEANQAAAERVAGQQAGTPKSQDVKLPTNTNQQPA